MSTPILYWTRSGTSSQCSEVLLTVTVSNFLLTVSVIPGRPGDCSEIQKANKKGVETVYVRHGWRPIEVSCDGNWTVCIMHILVYSRVSDIVAGTIFRLGKQKLVKNNQDNQIHSITLCSVYFSSRYTQCTMGSGAKPQKLGIFFREFLC